MNPKFHRTEECPEIDQEPFCSDTISQIEVVFIDQKVQYKNAINDWQEEAESLSQ